MTSPWTLFTCVLLFCGDLVANAADELIAIPASSHEIVDGGTKKRKLTVWISEFRSGRTEVTQRQYEEVVGTDPAHYRG